MTASDRLCSGPDGGVLLRWPEIDCSPNRAPVAVPSSEVDILRAAEWAITEARTDKSVIVLTCSELFLTRVQRRIAEKVIHASLVSITRATEAHDETYAFRDDGEPQGFTMVALLHDQTALSSEQDALRAARFDHEDPFRPF